MHDAESVMNSETAVCSERMADKTVDGGAWTGCAVMFLQSLCPAVNLLALYKDQREGKFIVFKVIKLTLIGKCRLAFYLGQLQHTVSGNTLDLLTSCL